MSSQCEVCVVNMDVHSAWMNGTRYMYYYTYIPLHKLGLGMNYVGFVGSGNELSSFC